MVPKEEMRILIIEDDHDLRNAMATMLGMMFPGKILTAEEGTQALALINNEEYKIGAIITDINMPNGMDGISFLEALGDNSKNSVKIVISGYIKNFENEKLSLICDHVFEKPVDLKIIAKIISSYPF